MYNAPLLPDAAIIDKGLDKVTKSRGAMDNIITLRGKITLTHIKTKMVTNRLNNNVSVEQNLSKRFNKLNNKGKDPKQGNETIKEKNPKR